MILKSISIFNHAQDTGIKVTSLNIASVSAVNTWTNNTADSEVQEGLLQTYLEEDSSQDTLTNYRTLTGQNIRSVFIVYFSRDSEISYSSTASDSRKEYYIYFNRNGQYLSNDFNPSGTDIIKLKVINVDVAPGMVLKNKQAICIEFN